MFSTLRHTLFVLILAPNRRHIRKYEGDMHSGLPFFFLLFGKVLVGLFLSMTVPGAQGSSAAGIPFPLLLPIESRLINPTLLETSLSQV